MSVVTRLALAFAFSWSSSCSVASYAADADAEVDEVLADATAKSIAGLPERVVRPEPAKLADPPKAPADPRPEAVPAVALELDLDLALRLSVQGNRDYKSQREQLYQQGLAFTSTRFEFGPQLSNTVAAAFRDRETSRGVLSLDTRADVRQILPTGGTVTIDGGMGFDQFSGPNPDTWASNASVSLRQPLLQGAGYAVSHESWTQAQREMVYAVRVFELYRQGFAIEIARDYFDLTSQKRTLANQERTYLDAVFDRKKGEALFSVGRSDDQQVFRARRREIETENSMIAARAGYQQAIDAFRLRLALPESTKIEVLDQDPEYAPVDMDDDSAVRAARHNRLELVTQKEQIEDSERQLAIAADDLRPDLNLAASYGLDGSGGRFDTASPHDWSSSVGVTMVMPLQRTRQRNSVRNAQITVDQRTRSYQLLQDRIAIEVRDQLRQLRSIEQQIALQRDEIVHEKRAVAIMQIRYESGTVDNRDLLEARKALIDAENALIRLLVDHFVRRLDLHRSIGVLFIDADGRWS